MQNIIQIHPCLLKLSRKQESVTDGQTDRLTDCRYYYIPHRYRGGIITFIVVIRLESLIVQKSLGAGKQKGLNRIVSRIRLLKEVDLS